MDFQKNKIYRDKAVAFHNKMRVKALSLSNKDFYPFILSKKFKNKNWNIASVCASHFDKDFGDLLIQFVDRGLTTNTGEYMSRGVRFPYIRLALPFDSHQVKSFREFAEYIPGIGNALIHELIHFQDSIRIGDFAWEEACSGGRYYGDNGQVNSEAYFNHPLEFHAYFQEGIAHLEEMNKYCSYEEEFQKRGINSFSTFAEIMPKRIFNSSFVDHLNSKYKRKLIKALYGVYCHIQDEIKNEHSRENA